MRSGAKVCKSCRSRQGLSNDYLLAKIRFDTAEITRLSKFAKKSPKVRKKLETSKTFCNGSVCSSQLVTRGCREVAAELRANRAANDVDRREVAARDVGGRDVD